MTDTIFDEKTTTRNRVKEPSKYKVVVFNDDFTPMEFVIAMFMTVFGKNETDAIKLMLSIHNEGSAIAGVYSHEIAEQKVVDATTLARNNGHPLILKAQEE
jgi:ATP-dependent Clp protease adaptor protein ClpS